MHFDERRRNKKNEFSQMQIERHFVTVVVGVVYLYVCHEEEK
jgi:hypothetical protein